MYSLRFVFSQHNIDWHWLQYIICLVLLVAMIITPGSHPILEISGGCYELIWCCLWFGVWLSFIRPLSDIMVYCMVSHVSRSIPWDYLFIIFDTRLLIFIVNTYSITIFFASFCYVFFGLIINRAYVYLIDKRFIWAFVWYRQLTL